MFNPKALLQGPQKYPIGWIWSPGYEIRNLKNLLTLDPGSGSRGKKKHPIPDSNPHNGFYELHLELRR